MGRVDLHLHTHFSDGALSPRAVVEAAAERGMWLIAVTDHDEIGGVPEAQTAGAALGVRVLSGVEINTDVGREDVHILGYGFLADASALRDGLGALRAARLTRAAVMVKRLDTLGYPVDMDRLLAIAGEGSIGRPHVAKALVEAGHAASAAEAFERLIGRGCPAYVPRAPFTPAQAIALIHRAGGIASLAHPGKLGDLIRFLRTLKAAGLDALEAYHTDHTPAVTTRMLGYARQFGLAVTGGSDSHGPASPRPVAIGAVDVPDAVGEQLLALIAQQGERHGDRNDDATG